MVYLFYGNTYISFMPFAVKKLILIIIATNTLILPVIVLPFFVQYGVIRSLSMDTHKERILPLAFILIPYLFSVYFLYKIPVPNIIANTVLGGAIIITTALLISIRWKISLHLLGAGGVVGFLISLSIKYHIDVHYLLAACLFLSGVIAMARLQLLGHSPSQIYTGFLLGFLIMFSIIIIL